MATELPMITRSCGKCEECCRVVAIAELNKDYHTRCKHQTGSGCAIYGSHPAECKDYKCAWLIGMLEEEMRPDKIGILVDAEDTFLIIQEGHQGALNSEMGRKLVGQIISTARELGGGVRIEPYGAHRKSASTNERTPGFQ